METTAHNQGVDANRMGKPLSANPFTDARAAEWANGWRAEQALFDEANNSRPPGTADLSELHGDFDHDAMRGSDFDRDH